MFVLVKANKSGNNCLWKDVFFFLLFTHEVGQLHTKLVGTGREDRGGSEHSGGEWGLEASQWFLWERISKAGPKAWDGLGWISQQVRGRWGCPWLSATCPELLRASPQWTRAREPNQRGSWGIGSGMVGYTGGVHSRMSCFSSRNGQSITNPDQKSVPVIS